MQMRFDLLACYAGLLGTTLATLVIPIPVFIQMLITTSLIIYIGAHQAVTNSSNSQQDTPTETIERYDAYMFPIIGSCVLFGLYIVFKIFPRILMVTIFKLYFMLGGVYVVAARISALIIGLCQKDQEQKIRDNKFTLKLDQVNTAVRPVVVQLKAGITSATKACEPLKPTVAVISENLSKLKYTLITLLESEEAAEKARALDNAPSEDNDATTAGKREADCTSFSSVPSSNADDVLPSSITFDGVLGLSYGLSLLLAVLYLITNHWLFNNIFGICFSIQAIELINLGSYINGVIILCGLFIYDIFWVFGTEVMVTVAKSVDAPIKLLFPQADRPSMLGLGDIVIPGIFVVLMLRIDLFLKRPLDYRKNATKPFEKYLGQLGALTTLDISTEYFNCVMVGYVVGLLLTIGVMLVFNAAQPALLYLVPACLASTAGVAFLLGPDEFKTIVEYSETPEKQGGDVKTKVDDAKTAISSGVDQVKSSVDAVPSQ